MKRRWVPLILGLFMIVACSRAGYNGKSSVSVEELIDTEWALEQINGRNVIDRVQSTLRFEKNDRVTGWGGCNRYFAGIRFDRDFIDIGPIGSTKRICPPVVMGQEDRFFKALGRAHRFYKQGPYLIIECAGIAKPLKFVMIER